MKPRGRTSSPDIQIGNSLNVDPKVVANEFNKYFSNVASNVYI